MYAVVRKQLQKFILESNINKKKYVKLIYSSFFSTKFAYHILYDHSGDNMNKKFLGWIGIAILTGLILGNIFYKQYEKEQNLDNEYNSYLLQLGVYKTKEDIKKNVGNVESYMVVENNNLYYVYLGISTKKDNAEKVKDAFLDNDIKVSIKKTVIDNIEFMSNLEQFDVLLDNASSNEDIMSINEVIMSSYEEMVLKK